jgi:hypothetical protein
METGSTRVFIAKDPSIGTNNIVPIEDLSILVELEVTKRSRATILTDANGTILETSKNGTQKISFIPGSTINGEKVLTTNYTNIGHDWKNGTTILTNESDDDLESLGITNIDISFNSSYAPQIVIDFIDIRGNAILEKGMSSKYNVFFSLPYPMFKLTVKGYYGQAVSYCLHLIKWNAKFNSHTGNFEIKAEFVGYTYAFLTDMLIGYLRAAIETPEGAKILEEKKKLSSNKNLMSINELIKRINTFNTYVSDLNKNNSDIKQFSAIQVDLSELDTIRSSFDLFIKDIEDSNKPVSTINNKHIYYNNNSLLNAITNFNNDLQTLTNKNSAINKTLTGSLTLNIKYGNGNLWSTATITDINKKPLDPAMGQNTPNSDIATVPSQITLNEIINKAKENILQNINTDTTLLTIDFTDALAEIDRVYNLLIATKNQLMIKITDTLKTEANNDKLKLTLNNIIEILCVHVDIFMELIRRTANKTKNNTRRFDKFNIKGYEYTDIPENTFNGSKDGNIAPTIYPFPAYINQGVESWFSLDITKDDGIPESKLIEELLSGFLVVTNSDNLLESQLNNETSWFPVSVLDTNIRNVNPSISTLFNNINPYYKLNNVNSTNTLIDTIIKRAFIFLSFSNNMCTDNEINTMAKIDANNLSDNVTSNTIRQLLDYYTPETLINTYLNNNKKFTSYTNPNYFFSKPVYLLSEDITLPGSDQTYGLYTPFSENKHIQNYNFLKIINNDDYNSLNRPPVDGLPQSTSTLVLNEEFITPEKPTGLNYDLFHGKLGVLEFFEVKKTQSDETITSDLLFWKETKNKNSFSYTTVNTNTVSEIQKFINDGSFSIDKPFIGFNTVINVFESTGLLYSDLSSFHSLFGSEFYFRQADNIFNGGYTDNKNNFVSGIDVANRSKAILFLHTLPLGDLDEQYGGLLYLDSSENEENNSYRKLLFENRGGFLKAPDAWLCLIGGLLWRYKTVNVLNLLKQDPIIFGDTIKCFIPNQRNNNLPKVDEYLKCNIKTNDNGFNEPMRFAYNTSSYTKIESVLLNLPSQAIDELINYFIDFVDNYFISNIKNVYEIDNVSDDITKTQYEILKSTRESTFNTLLSITSGLTKTVNSSLVNTSDLEYATTLTKTSLTTNINVINLCQYIFPDTQINVKNTITNNNNTNNYHIQYIKSSNDSSNNISDIIHRLINPKIVANSTWRIWTDYLIKGNDFKYNYNDNFLVSQDNLNKYLITFLNTFKASHKNISNMTKTQSLQQQAFGTMDTDTIKLNLYRTIKAIYDKWIAGSDLDNNFMSDCACNNKQFLFNSFRFIDKGFQDIGDDFIINPQSIINELKHNTNQSFYDLVTRILASNNIDFIPLPSYIDFNNEEQVNKIFTPITYKSFVSDSNATVGPSFVCVYIGQPSKHLDGNKDDYPSDSVQLDITSLLPKEFTSESKYKVPVFQVNYAQGNQHMFKDIQLDQSQFSETDESLHVIDEISLKGDSLNRTPIGQNLFNVYSVRAYQATIESMGNAMIQPMMYFQLNNIPMFKGGYLITNVTHKIRPNNMSTTFKGVRINKIYTPLISETDLYMNLIGGVTDVDVTKVKIIPGLPVSPTSQSLGITDKDIINANNGKNNDNSNWKAKYDIIGMFRGSTPNKDNLALGKNRYKSLMIKNEGYNLTSKESLEDIAKKRNFGDNGYGYTYGIGHKDLTPPQSYTGRHHEKEIVFDNPIKIIDETFYNDTLIRKNWIDKKLNTLNVRQISENLYYALISLSFSRGNEVECVPSDLYNKFKIDSNGVCTITREAIDFWLSYLVGHNPKLVDGLQNRRKQEVTFALTGKIT